MSHYSKGQYGHEPIIDPLNEALFRTWQHVHGITRICAKDLEREELSIEERLAHPKCRLEGSERVAQTVASAAAAYYNVKISVEEKR
jgi:hypothetical protein